MAKTNITLYSSTPSSNTDINSINIDENCPASGLNNAIRELMAHLKNVDTGSQALTALSVTGDTTISSGNLLVGKTSSGVANDGFEAQSTGQTVITQASADVLRLNRKTSDGTIIDLRKDGTTVGSVGTVSNRLYMVEGNTGFSLVDTGNAIYPAESDGTNRDNAIDLGASGARWKDLYLSGGVYLGGTGSANYLDNVETGDWTPAYGGSTGNPTVTYGTQKGSYVKVGNFVHVQGRVRTNTTSGGSGTLRVTGLPFPNVNQSGHYTTLHIGYNNQWSPDHFPTSGLYNANTSFVTLYTARNSDARDGIGITINVSDLTTGTNNNDIIFSMTYRTD